MTRPAGLGIHRGGRPGGLDGRLLGEGDGDGGGLGVEVGDGLGV